jgi:hypothetical protein
MIRGTNRQVFSENLHIAVLADEIASSLRHISESKQLLDRDRRVMNMATELLAEILRGRDATKNKMVEDSLEASLAYGQAIQAVRLKPSRFATFESFEKLLAYLNGQLKEIEAARTFNVEDLYEFFSAIRELAITGGARKFESVSVSGVE